jgi:hypothetical protein
MRQERPPKLRTRIPKRERIAYHEAGHAVLSAAINDAPHLVSIRGSANSLGRSRYGRDASPERLVQVHLAGFAAEEILKGCRSRQLLGPELALSVSAVLEPHFASVAALVEGSDQHLAVQELLKMGCTESRDGIYAAFERYYAVARASLLTVWPAVVTVARTLLKNSELDRHGFRTAIRGHDIHTPVSGVQAAHGIP